MKKLAKKSFYYNGYDEYLYTGIQGFVMRQNHRILSKNVPYKVNRKILEIGGGAKPHCSLIALEGVGDYWVSDSKEVLESNVNISNMSIKKHLIEDDPDYNFFSEKGMLFSRIIASHVWEHISDPEEALLKWIGLLEEDGQLDIAIPCDPGWAWRFGQLVGRKKAMESYRMSSEDIDLMMTREHINSCQNLIRIVKSYTKVRGNYFPFFVPITDINLFVFFRLKKSDF
jgi:hypothetical protein